MRQIAPDTYEISLGGVNGFLLTADDALVLIDTGYAGSEGRIAAALAEIGRIPADLTHLVVTHCHPDHAGSLAALQAQSDAVTIMHPLDAALVTQGRAKRPMTPGPGLLTRLLYRRFIAPAPDTIPTARVDQTVVDGDVLPFAGGLRVVHVPGHSAGQIALLAEQNRVLFAADAAMNLPWLSVGLGFEDVALARDSAARLATLPFEIACFGHGKPLRRDAAARFKKTFGRDGRSAQ